jgi:ankyrin repeat protein
MLGTLYGILNFSLGNARIPFRPSIFKEEPREERCSDLAKVLIECGANVNSQDMNNSTPLHFASNIGYLDSARLLLDHGADPNALDNNHVTPLHLASERGHLEIVQLLLLHGANHDADVANTLIERVPNVNSQDTNNQMPLHFASKFEPADIA